MRPPDFEFTGDQWHAAKRSIVYAWIRPREGKPDEWLYVGQSKNGLNRPFDIYHHVFNKIDTPRSTDKVVWWVMQGPKAAKMIESKLIAENDPRYNIEETERAGAHWAYCDRCHHVFYSHEKAADDRHCGGTCCGRPYLEDLSVTGLLEKCDCRDAWAEEWTAYEEHGYQGPELGEQEKPKFLDVRRRR